MRIITLISALLLFSFSKAISQCDFVNSLDIVDAPNIFLAADAECTDAEGWTHYYNTSNDILLISIKKNGQDIGDLNNGLNISTSTKDDYGTIGFNLSNADYIDNEVWLVANRSWHITGATPINDPIQVRFYLNDTDFDDIETLQQNLGISFPLDFDKLNMYTISEGNGLDAYETETQLAGAAFTFYDMAPGASPDWVSGMQNSFRYGEFESNSTDIAGSVGILFFVDNPAVAISGNISKPNAAPVPNVNVSVPGGNTVVTDLAGNYFMPDLNVNLDYELIPEKNTGFLEDISITDLIRLSGHLVGVDLFTSPFEYIAADADNDTNITPADLFEIINLLLGETTMFSNNTSWRFVPENYVFQNPANPFSPPFPESISYMSLPDSLFNQNFTGVKIGDVGEASLNPPPNLNTTFLLPEVSTCLPGEEIVFDLTVEDFQGIRGFQFTLEWDKDVMSFISVDNFNLLGLTPLSIGTSLADDGFITFAWVDPALAGISIPDGTVIGQLLFITTANVNDTTPLNFTNGITDALIVHQNMAEEMPLFVDGGTVIGNNTNIITDAFLEPADCDGSAIGSIDLTVTGAVQPVTFFWSNGEMTEDISMLAPDIYTVTITDASGGCPKIVSYEILPGGQFEILADVTDMSCPTQLNGSIDLNIQGGATPFTFQWSNGDDTEMIDGLYKGIYEVTVADAVGCTQTASFEIENPNRIIPKVTVMNANNTNASNGAIMINEIIGGFPPFTFQWSNGATTQSIQNIPPGNYAVTITDQIGCGHVFGYLVHDLMVAIGEIDGVSLEAGIFPNPVKMGGNFTLAIGSPVSGEMEVSIFSTNGQLANRTQLQLQEGANNFPLPAPETSGFYLLQIIFENETAGWLKMVVR